MNNNSSQQQLSKDSKNGILYIVGTPIGNLDDFSQRAIEILKNVSLVACEDTRQTKKIMNKFIISNKLISFNKHNSFNKIPKLISKLKAGNQLRLLAMQECRGFASGEDIVQVKSKELMFSAYSRK